MIANKLFNEDLCKKNDPKARAAMLDFLQGRGINAIENPDRYGIDILDMENNRGFELERRGKWKTGEHPYALVNLLARKLHLFKGLQETNNYYVIFNQDCSQFIYISAADMFPYLLIEDVQIEDCFVPSEGWREDWVYKIPLYAFKSVVIQKN